MFGWGKSKEHQLVVDGGAPVVLEKNETVLNGAVRRWWVREWTTVVGRDAATELPPPFRDSA